MMRKRGECRTYLVRDVNTEVIALILRYGLDWCFVKVFSKEVEADINDRFRSDFDDDCYFVIWF